MDPLELLLPMLPSLKSLRQKGKKPRVHPNGFIQLDLDKIHRLHVWHPELPYRQKTYHPIHDHVFDFESVCLKGRLVHAVYAPTPTEDGTHVLWQAKQIGPEETILEPINGTRVDLDTYPGQTRSVQAGEEYTFKRFKFHETLSNEPTMTLMKKQGLTLKQGAAKAPRIAVPYGVEPDNNFRRENHNEDILWKLITETHPCP